jgi:hypothetical protein
MHRRDMFAIFCQEGISCACLSSNQACQDKMGVFIGLFISRRITRQVEFILVNNKIPAIIETYSKPGGLFTWRWSRV